MAQLTLSLLGGFQALLERGRLMVLLAKAQALCASGPEKRRADHRHAGCRWRSSAFCSCTAHRYYGFNVRHFFLIAQREHPVTISSRR
ncbi:MAG TPA: hypothetical protein VKJ47_14810 [Candidatus Binatia bacterium]|nr:hypothetical protein [Candidatus Binatia bacterium]